MCIRDRIHNWSGPTEKAKQIDVTSLDSSAMEFIPGLMDPGEVTLEGNYVAGDTAQKGIRADLVARVKRNFQLILTDGHPTASPAVAPTTIAFVAVVTDFQIKGGADEKISFSATLKISGVPTITYAAS